MLKSPVFIGEGSNPFLNTFAFAPCVPQVVIGGWFPFVDIFIEIIRWHHKRRLKKVIHPKKQDWSILSNLNLQTLRILFCIGVDATENFEQIRNEFISCKTQAMLSTSKISSHINNYYNARVYKEPMIIALFGHIRFSWTLRIHSYFSTKKFIHQKIATHTPIVYYYFVCVLLLH